jgi:hypothetical protein
MVSNSRPPDYTPSNPSPGSSYRWRTCQFTYTSFEITYIADIMLHCAQHMTLEDSFGFAPSTLVHRGTETSLGKEKAKI